MLTPPEQRPWVVTGRRHLFSGGPIIEVAVEQLRLPNGSELADYYQIRMADFALVYATTEGGDVMLFRQYKHGPKRVCLAFPGGALAAGESPLDAARRELLEETGCVSDRWSTYGAFVTNGNQHCNTAHLFRADGCRRISEPTAADVEAPELLLCSEEDLVQPDIMQQFALASHFALLAAGTHPRCHAAPIE